MTITADSTMFQKALAVIKSSGADYLIILPTGERFGSVAMLELAKAYDERAKAKTRTRRALKHPYGALKNHYTPYIKDLPPGGYVEVPFGPFHGNELASAISARGGYLWGRGNVMTSANKTKGVVEVLRADVPAPGGEQVLMQGL